MKICKDGRVWGQNNKEAGSHLGVITGRKKYIGKGVKGASNPMYGRQHSMETKGKIAQSRLGEKHPRWKGGISSKQAKLRGRIEFKIWRNAVFVRDNWTCQECGNQGVRLVAHHIKSFAEYPELRLAIDNGKTLCYQCHRLTDNFSGRVK